MTHDLAPAATSPTIFWCANCSRLTEGTEAWYRRFKKGRCACGGALTLWQPSPPYSSPSSSRLTPEQREYIAYLNTGWDTAATPARPGARS